MKEVIKRKINSNVLSYCGNNVNLKYIKKTVHSDRSKTMLMDIELVHGLKKVGDR